MRMGSVIMLTGFAIIAVPTGIVTTELGREMQAARSRRRCRECGWEDHDSRALPAMRRERSSLPARASRYMPHQSIHSIGSQLSTCTLMRLRRLASGSDV